MRSVTKMVALTVFAATTFAAPMAFAGFDEAGENSFWTNQSTAPAVTAPQHSSNERYRATYAAPSPQAPAAAQQKDPSYFYHAMGTMGAQ